MKKIIDRVKSVFEIDWRGAGVEAGPVTRTFDRLLYGEDNEQDNGILNDRQKRKAVRLGSTATTEALSDRFRAANSRLIEVSFEENPISFPGDVKIQRTDVPESFVYTRAVRDVEFLAYALEVAVYNQNEQNAQNQQA